MLRALDKPNIQVIVHEVFDSIFAPQCYLLKRSHNHICGYNFRNKCTI